MRWGRKKKNREERRRGWGASGWDRRRRENVRRLEAGNKRGEMEGKGRKRGTVTAEERKKRFYEWLFAIKYKCTTITTYIIFLNIKFYCYYTITVFPPVSNNEQTHSDRFCLTIFHILASSAGDRDVITLEISVLLVLDRAPSIRMSRIYLLCLS